MSGRLEDVIGERPGDKEGERRQEHDNLEVGCEDATLKIGRDLRLHDRPERGRR